MDKEAQIYDLLLEILTTPCLQSKQGEAYRLAKLLYGGGYRKLPKDKPPLLGEEKVFELLGITELPKADEAIIMLHQDVAFVGKIAQAQREADIKHYETD